MHPHNTHNALFRIYRSIIVMPNKTTAKRLQCWQPFHYINRRLSWFCFKEVFHRVVGFKRHHLLFSGALKFRCILNMVRFQVLTEANINMAILRYVTPCSIRSIPTFQTCCFPDDKGNKQLRNVGELYQTTPLNVPVDSHLFLKWTSQTKRREIQHLFWTHYYNAHSILLITT